MTDPRVQAVLRLLETTRRFVELAALAGQTLEHTLERDLVLNAFAQELVAAADAAAEPSHDEADLNAALAEIAAECRRHVEEEGWTAEHDDGNPAGELAGMGGSYAFSAGSILQGHGGYDPGSPPDIWPRADEWWKPTMPLRDLVKAASLIVAEIRRLDRAARRQP